MRVVWNDTEVLDHKSISLPSSKSLSHRAIITASLADGESCLKGIAMSRDIEATIQVMEKAGASFRYEGEDMFVCGNGGKQVYDGTVLDCGESGSTIRFLIPFFTLGEKKAIFTGHGRLMERPQTVYEELFCDRGLLFEKDDDRFCVQGPLKGGKYEVRGDISSQFISGLLFAFPLCQEDSAITILPPFESESYVGLTLQALERAGIHIERKGYTYFVPGRQKYCPFVERVEGDDSQMAFFAELALLNHKEIYVKNVNPHSIQGDHVIVDLMRAFGGKVVEDGDGYWFSKEAIRGIHADLSDCPDLGPALFALATCAKGDSVFTGCRRLRMKESDRIAAMEEELRKLGCSIHSDEDTVYIQGNTQLRHNVVLSGHNDHRIVMALSMLTTRSKGCVMEGVEAVEKSYPRFFEDLAALGVTGEMQ